MSAPATPYTITAAFKGKPQTATRINPASAMCLADEWLRLGGSDITIADREGVAHSPDQFRAKLPLRRLINSRQQ